MKGILRAVAGREEKMFSDFDRKSLSCTRTNPNVCFCILFCPGNWSGSFRLNDFDGWQEKGLNFPLRFVFYFGSPSTFTESFSFFLTFVKLLKHLSTFISEQFWLKCRLTSRADNCREWVTSRFNNNFNYYSSAKVLQSLHCYSHWIDNSAARLPAL